MKYYFYGLRLLVTSFILFAQMQVKAQCLVSQIKINTGYDPVAGVLVSPGSTDPFWTVTGFTPSLGTFTTPYQSNVIPPYTPGPWATNSNSNWISFDNTSSPAMGPTGPWEWTVERKFTTCSADDIVFDFYVSSDDYIPDLRVDNVTQYGQTASSNWGSYTHVTFTITALSAGVHTIAIDQAEAPGATQMGLDLYGTVGSVAGNNSIVSDACPTYSCTPLACDFTYCFSTSSPLDYKFQPSLSLALAGYNFNWYENTTTFIGNTSGTSPLPHTFSAAGAYDIRMDVIDPITNQVVCSVNHQACTGSVYSVVGNLPCDFTYCYDATTPNLYTFTADNVSYSSSLYIWYMWGPPMTAPTYANFTYVGAYSTTTSLSSGDYIGMAIHASSPTSGSCRLIFEFCTPAYLRGNTSREGNIKSGRYLTRDASILNTNPINDNQLPFEGIILSPNPANDMVTVLVNIPHSGKTDFTVLDVTGRQVQHFVHSLNGTKNEKVDVSVTDLPAGVYQLRVNAGENIYSATLVKK